MSLKQHVVRFGRDMEPHGRVGEFFKGIRYLMLSPKGDPAKEAERAAHRIVLWILLKLRSHRVQR